MASMNFFRSSTSPDHGLRRDPPFFRPPSRRARGPIRPATLLDGEPACVAARALARRHRILQAIVVPTVHRLMRYHTMHYELVPP